MHWLKLLKNNLNQQLFKSKHLQVSYLEGARCNGDFRAGQREITHGFTHRK
jgi:hypothetical protein